MTHREADTKVVVVAVARRDLAAKKLGTSAAKVKTGILFSFPHRIAAVTEVVDC